MLTITDSQDDRLFYKFLCLDTKFSINNIHLLALNKDFETLFNKLSNS